MEEHLTTLNPSDGYAVLINTFRVQPERAEALIKILADATDTMRNMPGFVSANLHLSSDKTRVVNYAQWRSQTDFEMMLQNEEAKPHMKAAADLADSYEPILYSLRVSGS